ncbi:cytochrome P450 [Actinophytocola gossypii]|uniref:Cytochrome P450 n=1 Tax=Actinophytocola gossypii TaxID=2812003 RepID=A0ABT2J614_9PSEU|nr:cytochrome P450 [Actinophytocola gossypii]MCT2583121.1 cytochrome P450 [Actinophytocola gossypii]
MTDQQQMLYDPFAPGFTDDPYPHYARVRELDPVHQHPLGFWLLTAYDDVAALLRSGLSVDYHNLADGLIFRQQDELLGENVGTPLNLALVDRDPPDHTRLRGLVSKVFTPRAIAALEPAITELVDSSLDTMAERRRADLIETLAFPVPFAVISTMLGLPEADHVRVRELSGILVGRLEFATSPERIRAIVAADRELTGIVRDLIRWKRAHPGDDLLSALIEAEVDGHTLTEDEVVAQVVLLYVSGHETTVNLIGNGVVALLRHPDQLAALRDRPELAGNAVEEILRYDTPVQQSRRITTSPCRVRDRAIPPGVLVIPCLGAANRDPGRFGPDADRLRIARPEARAHVSFGAGRHHCLGAALARLEGRIAIERLTQRFPGLAQDGEITWNGRVNLRGAQAVPVLV